MAYFSCNFPSLLCPSLFLIFFLFCLNNQNHFFSLSTFSTLSNHHHAGSGVARIEDSLARARVAIYNAARTNRTCAFHKHHRFVPAGSAYKNPHAFHQLSNYYLLICVFPADSSLYTILSVSKL